MRAGMGSKLQQSHRVNPGQLNGVWLGEMDLMNRVHTQASPGGSGVACGGWPGGPAWQGSDGGVGRRLDSAQQGTR
jgi:hypothetical protein